MAKIEKKMERESALKVIDELKNNICDVDLDEICGDSVKVVEGDSKDEQKIFNKVVQAVQCGLVYWDEDEKCMVQELIHPLKSGQIEADKLFYKNNVTLADAKSAKSQNPTEMMIISLAVVTGRAIQLVEKLRGQDLNIAIGCLSFFDK